MQNWNMCLIKFKITSLGRDIRQLQATSYQKLLIVLIMDNIKLCRLTVS